ncbi:MAG: ATP-binding protein [Armatimonadota bacterium]
MGERDVVVMVVENPEMRENLLRVLEQAGFGFVMEEVAIAELRNTEVLKESERKFRELFEGASDAIFVIEVGDDNTPGHFIEANGAATQMLGYSRDQLLSMTPNDIGLQREDLYLFTGPVMGDLSTIEVTLVAEDGRKIQGESSTRIVEVSGSMILMCIIRDITERKRVEEALTRENEVTKAMNDLKSALLASSSIEELSSRVFKYAKQLTGGGIGLVGYIELDTGDLVATTLSEEMWDVCNVRDKDPVFHKIGGLLGWILDNKMPILANSPKLDPRSGGVPEGHLPIDRLLGVPAVLGNNVVGLLAVANASREYCDEDLATMQRLAAFYSLAIQHKRSEEVLAKHVENLARSNADLQQFAYIASHDLQEPLRMVSSYVQLLARRYQGKLDKDADEFIEFAVDGAHRMQALINGLLEYSRVSTRGIQFEPVSCDAVLDSALRNLQVAVEESGAIVTRDPLPEVNGDAVQLVQLLQNLIVNAIKFRSDDPLCVHVSVEMTGDEWIFSVRDNGIGIAPENAERIFQLFERLQTEKGGTGLGLAICRKIVERHHGRIWVESELGRGSIFYFTIPVDTYEH